MTPPERESKWYGYAALVAVPLALLHTPYSCTFEAGLGQRIGDSGGKLRSLHRRRYIVATGANPWWTGKGNGAPARAAAYPEEGASPTMQASRLLFWNAGIKMQARRLRCGRPPLIAAFASHDRHPVAQASRLLFWNAGIKMQARRLRCGRPPLIAAFASHDKHPVAQA